MLFDQVPDSAGKAFKATEGVDGDGSNRRVVPDNRGMVTKAKVDNLPAGVRSGVYEGENKSAIVVQVGNPPDHVIADSKAIQNLIQPTQAGGNPVIRLERFVADHGRIR